MIHARWITLPALAWLASATPPAVVAGPPRVEVRGRGEALGETPVVAELAVPVAPGPYRLEPSEGGPAIAANVFEDGGKVYLGAVLDKVAAEGVATYSLIADPNPTSPGVRLTPEGPNVDVAVGGKPLTVYRVDSGPKPCYWPLLGPTGAAMTRAFPIAKAEGETRDHPHHRSFFFTHGSVDGVDFWTELLRHGTIKETSRPSIVSGPAVGQIRTTDDWLAADGRKVCRDKRLVRFYETKAGRVLDFEVTLFADAKPITFGDTKEGTFGIRVASSMDVDRKKGGRIENAEGLVDGATWGKPSPWVDYVGPVGNETLGIAVLDHPESFRHPTTWHVRTYGLFAANPFGYHDFGLKSPGQHVLPAGESIRFRYRIILHEGDTAKADLPGAFKSYAKPPEVSVRVD